MNDWWNLLACLRMGAAGGRCRLAKHRNRGRRGLVAAWLVRRRPALRAAILLSAAALSLAVPLLSTVVRSSGGGLLAPPVRAGNRPAAVSHAASGQRCNRRQPSGDCRPGFAQQRLRLPLRIGRAPTGLAGRGAGLSVAGWLRRAIWHSACCVECSPCAAGSDWPRPVATRKIEAALSRASPGDRRAAAGIAVELGVRFAGAGRCWAGRGCLLPSEMPADVDWFAVFCHELAHRARRDDLSRLAGRVGGDRRFPGSRCCGSCGGDFERLAKRRATTGPWPPAPIRSSLPRCWWRWFPSAGRHLPWAWPKVRRPRGIASCVCWP